MEQPHIPMGILARDRAGYPVSLDDPDYGVIDAIIEEAHRICAEMNAGCQPPARVRELFARLTGTAPEETLRIYTPFYAGFGRNIRVGKNVFINSCCMFMDRGGIAIGDHAFVGPNVNLITTSHALDPAGRRTTISRPIVLGKNVWIGAAAILLPGVTVGDNSVIGAGAVVTRDVPANTVVAGNPARVIREL